MQQNPDETLQTILDAIAPDDNLGVILAVQMGGTPQEVQILVQSTEYDAEKDAIRPTGQYIIRAIGVAEHHVAVGLFRNMVFSTDNALLHPFNSPVMRVHFTGTPQNVDSLMIDLNQLYGQTYGIYEPSRRMASEINSSLPLSDLLASGEGILAVMPAPFAEKAKKVLEQHGLSINLVEHQPEHEHDHQHIPMQSLIMDDSYFIAQMFSAEPMGSV